MTRLQIQKSLNQPEKLSLSTKNEHKKNLLILDYAKKNIHQIHTLAYSLEEYLNDYEFNLSIRPDPYFKYMFVICIAGVFAGEIGIHPKEIANLEKITAFSKKGTDVHLAIRKIWDNRNIKLTQQTAESVFILEKPCKLKIKKTSLSMAESEEGL